MNPTTISGWGRTTELIGRVIQAMQNEIGVVDKAICDVFPLDSRHLEVYNDVETIKMDREKNPAMGRADRAVYEVATKRREPSHAVKWVHQKVKEQLANLPREEVEKYMLHKPEPPAPPVPAPAPAPEPAPEAAEAAVAAGKAKKKATTAAATAPKRTTRRGSKAAAAEAEDAGEELPAEDAVPSGWSADGERMWHLVEEMMAIAERVTARADVTDDVIKRTLELLDDDEIKQAKQTLREYLQGAEEGGTTIG